MSFTRISPGSIMSVEDADQDNLIIAFASKKGYLDSGDEISYPDRIEKIKLADGEVLSRLLLTLSEYNNYCLTTDYLYTVHEQTVRRESLITSETKSCEVPTSSSLYQIDVLDNDLIVSTYRDIWKLDFDRMQAELLFSATEGIRDCNLLGNGKLGYNALNEYGKNGWSKSFVVAELADIDATARSLHVNGSLKRVGNEVWILEKNRILSVNPDSMDTQVILTFEPAHEDNIYRFTAMSFDVSDDKKWAAWGDEQTLVLANLTTRKTKEVRFSKWFCYNRITSVNLTKDKVQVGFFSGWLGVSKIQSLFESK